MCTDSQTSLIQQGGKVMSELYGKMSEALIAGNIEEIKKLTKQALDEGTKARQVLEKGLLPGMDIVGQRFKACEMFIPEVLRSAKTMHAAMDVLQPHLTEGDKAATGTVIIGTVQGDLHDIGKNLVAMMFEGAGFKVVDLGTDVKPQAFVDAAKQHKPDILGMSALLTTTMPKMGETINALREAGIRNKIKVMAGGAPVTQDFVDEIGADAYGSNATVAVEKAKALMGRN
jgi:5-methyltetrahydrofolate--homocysteine methyltransferase